jgi:hypothetical protein
MVSLTSVAMTCAPACAKGLDGRPPDSLGRAGNQHGLSTELTHVGPSVIEMISLCDPRWSPVIDKDRMRT